MTTNLIISAHCDDGLWSMGSYIANRPEEKFIIVSPFDGIPKDEKGKEKHTRLNREHREACASYSNVKIVSGIFFDDVYESTRDLSELPNWFGNVLNTNDPYIEFDVYVPIGIKHPDHYLVRDIFIKHFRIDYFYEELPYRPRFASDRDQSMHNLCRNRTLITTPHNVLKEVACKKYVSQIDEGVLRDIFVEERIWK